MIYIYSRSFYFKLVWNVSNQFIINCLKRGFLFFGLGDIIKKMGPWFLMASKKRNKWDHCFNSSSLFSASSSVLHYFRHLSFSVSTYNPWHLWDTNSAPSYVITCPLHLPHAIGLTTEFLPYIFSTKEFELFPSLRGNSLGPTKWVMMRYFDV